MQARATAENLGRATENFLAHPDEMEKVRGELDKISHELRQNANQRAAEAVIDFVVEREMKTGKQ
jgi:lipid A disaccharide synthetase